MTLPPREGLSAVPVRPSGRLSGARKGLPSPKGKLEQKCCRKRPTRQSRPPPSCPSTPSQVRKGLEASAPNRQTAATMLPGEASQSPCFRVIARRHKGIPRADCCTMHGGVVCHPTMLPLSPSSSGPHLSCPRLSRRLALAP